MCLIVFAWKAHPVFPLVLAANRDEYFNRPSLPLAYWDDLPDVLGGRDIEKGGSWLATHTDGRWAAVTNFREGASPAASVLSRGHLVKNYVASGERARDYVSQVTGPLADYPGCNLLVGDNDALFFVSNRVHGLHRAEVQLVSEGVHGLSNHSLDTPWPKVARSKQILQQALAFDEKALVEELFNLLADRKPANEDALPSTGVPLEWERRLSAPFIVSENYGTRASTVVLMDIAGNVSVRERSFGSGGTELTRRAFTFNRSESRH